VLINQPRQSGAKAQRIPAATRGRLDWFVCAKKRFYMVLLADYFPALQSLVLIRSLALVVRPVSFTLFSLQWMKE
jgi:hypothetical protein